MVLESWILKMGNLLLESSFSSKNPITKTKKTKNKSNNTQTPTLGILCFEVASLMSRAVSLYRSLSDSEVSNLRSEVFKSQGVSTLVSSSESHLLSLALAERLEELDRVAGVVSRLGKKCAHPAMRGFEHVYADVVNGVVDVRELGVLVKDMEAMARRMERHVRAASQLHGELEALSEMERTLWKMKHQNQNQSEENRRGFEQKLHSLNQNVRHLKEVSLWEQSFDKVVELLARTVCTIYARICVVFGESTAVKGSHEGGSEPLDLEIDTQFKRVGSKNRGYNPEAKKMGTNGRPHIGLQGPDVSQHEDFRIPCGNMPSRLFLECLSLSSSTSKIDNDFVAHEDGRCSENEAKRGYPWQSDYCSQSQRGGSWCVGQRQSMLGSGKGTIFGRKCRLAAYASSCTVGGSSLALHYANVIIVIEKLLCYPHLVGQEARDDLYQMLPTSLKMCLRAELKAYARSQAIYDAPLAHAWKEMLDGRLKWLAPLAHNMIRWQSERNFEKQQIGTQTNVLLLQTLYFADRGKTEAAICELLVGLNYICRYEHQQNALLDLAGSCDVDDCMVWQLQQ